MIGNNPLALAQLFSNFDPSVTANLNLNALFGVNASTSADQHSKPAMAAVSLNNCLPPSLAFSGSSSAALMAATASPKNNSTTSGSTNRRHTIDAILGISDKEANNGDPPAKKTCPNSASGKRFSGIIITFFITRH